MTEISTSAPQSGDIATKKEDAVEFTVPGMGSNHCAGLITTSLERLAGVVGVRANIATHSVAVRFDPERTEAATMKAAIESAGYDVASVSEPASAEREVRLTVPDMGSDHCAGLVSASIRRLPGIVNIGANIARCPRRK